MESQSPTVVVLFSGDPRREERQKRLPRRFLSTIHDALLKTIRGAAGVDVLIARDVGGELCLGDGRWRLDSLAERIETAIGYGFSRGYTHVLLLAGDIVDVRREDVARAVQALDGSLRTAAVGLCGDGGFWAAGFSQTPALDWTRLLRDRSKAGAALIDALHADGFFVEELPIVDDVDSRADAERLIRLRRRPRALVRLRARLASMLLLLSESSAPPHASGDAALAFSSTFRGPPRSRCSF
jgi:glycosyltransferase A (GT-A) superfamily protein (DUF2064 family)